MSDVDDEANTDEANEMTADEAHAVFLSCCVALGKIPDDQRDEAVWHMPIYYQTAHAAEQVIRSAVEIIGICRYIQVGMEGPDFASLNDVQDELVNYLRALIRPAVERLYEYDLYDDYCADGNEEGNEEIIARMRSNIAFLKALGEVLKADAV
jgi:hypothetical protein